LLQCTDLKTLVLADCYFPTKLCHTVTREEDIFRWSRSCYGLDDVGYFVLSAVIISWIV